MSIYLVSGKVARESVHLRTQELTQNLGQDVNLRGPDLAIITQIWLLSPAAWGVAVDGGQG